MAKSQSYLFIKTKQDELLYSKSLPANQPHIALLKKADAELTNQALHPNQYAYTTGRSTDRALHLIMGRIEKFLNQQEAFNKTRFPKMHSRKIS